VVAMRSAVLTSLSVSSFVESSHDSATSKMNSSGLLSVASDEGFASIAGCRRLPFRAMGAVQALMCAGVLKAHDALENARTHKGKGEHGRQFHSEQCHGSATSSRRRDYVLYLGG